MNLNSLAISLGLFLLYNHKYNEYNFSEACFFVLFSKKRHVNFESYFFFQVTIFITSPPMIGNYPLLNKLISEISKTPRTNFPQFIFPIRSIFSPFTSYYQYHTKAPRNPSNSISMSSEVWDRAKGIKLQGSRGTRKRGERKSRYEVECGSPRGVRWPRFKELSKIANFSARFHPLPLGTRVFSLRQVAYRHGLLFSSVAWETFWKSLNENSLTPRRFRDGSVITRSCAEWSELWYS